MCTDVWATNGCAPGQMSKEMLFVIAGPVSIGVQRICQNQVI